MYKYELLYIINPATEEAKQQEITAKFKGLLEANGSKIVAVDLWGKRELATPIGQLHQGVYVLIKYEGDGAANRIIDDQFKITEEVIRHMVVKVDSFEKANAAA